MEKIINDSITLFPYNILKLLFTNFCTFFSYIFVYIELCGESHLRATVYKFTLDLILNYSISVHTFVFILLYIIFK